MSTRTWHQGPPPHVGWWNARTIGYRRHNIWRWWDGKTWSYGVYDIHSADNAAKAARMAVFDTPCPYEWRRHWPEGARVARINPATGEVTGKGGAA